MSGDTSAHTALHFLEDLKSQAERVAPEVLRLLGDAALMDDEGVAHRVANTLGDIEQVFEAIYVACDEVLERPQNPQNTSQDISEEACESDPVVVPPKASVVPPKTSPEIVEPDITAGDEYEHASAVLRFVTTRQRDSIGIGTIAFHIGSGQRLPREQYQQLMDFLNRNPRFEHTQGGNYRIIRDIPAAESQPELPPEPSIDIRPDRPKRKITRRSAIPDLSETDQPDAVSTTPQAAEPETAAPVEQAPDRLSSEALRIAQKELALFKRVEYLAYTRGYLSAKDLRGDKEVANILTKTEAAALWRRLPDIRDRILARVLEVGASARWAEKPNSTPKAHALAFFELRGSTALDVYAQLPNLSEADFMPNNLVTTRPKAGLKLASPSYTTEDAHINDAEPETPAVNPAVALEMPLRNTAPVPIREILGRAVAPVLPQVAPEEDSVPVAQTKFNIYRLLRPNTAPDWLSENARGQIRSRVEELFAALEADKVERETMVGFAARAWAVPKEGAAKMLQNMYDLRLIGKEVNGEAYFCLDPALRRKRAKVGSVNENGEIVQKAEKPKLNALDLHGSDIIDVMVERLTHVQQRMRPSQIAIALQEKGLEIKEDTIKKACRLLDTYIVMGQATGTNRSPHAKSRGQKVLMAQIRDQRVKDAWKNDREGVISAIRQGKTFDEYYDPQQD